MTRDELRSVLPGGKHHDVAMKWVANDDAVLQCAHIDGDIWQTVTKPYPSHVEPFCAERKWRIKPQTLRYRVALMRVNKCVFPTIVTCGNQAESLAHNPGFEEWATDWQEVEA